MPPPGPVTSCGSRRHPGAGWSRLTGPVRAISTSRRWSRRSSARTRARTRATICDDGASRLWLLAHRRRAAARQARPGDPGSASGRRASTSALPRTPCPRAHTAPGGLLRPGGLLDDLHEIGALIAGDEAFEDVGLDVAERGL